MVLDEAEANFAHKVFNLSENFLGFGVAQTLKVNA